MGENRNELKHRSSFIARVLSSLPNTNVLIFGLIILMVILTYIIPAGSFDREIVNGIEKVIPGSFHYIEQSPVHPFQIFTALYEGLKEASSVVVAVLVIAGSTAVFIQSKALDAFFGRLLKKKSTGKNQTYILVILGFLFAALGGIVGLYEETLVFVPFTIVIATALGYDAVVGVALCYICMLVGSAAALMNPATVMVAQQIAGLPIYSGMGFRAIMFVVMVSATIAYILHYGKKVKNSPEKSLVYGTDYSDMIEDGDLSSIEFTTRRKLALLIFVGSMLVTALGVASWGWGFANLCGMFVFMGIGCGLVMGLTPSQISDTFSKGASDFAFVTILIGIARGVGVVMDQGMIMDTIVNALIGILAVLPESLVAVGMFFIQSIINFFIPSGSGQAMFSMPIMIPVADVCNLNRQIAVLAFQLGDGLSNMIIPMMGGTAAAMQLSKVPFGKWLAFTGKLLLMLSALAIAFLLVATAIDYGPF